ncbi:MAG: glycoside hydrolase family 5 protein [Lachnospiraceae bacterium]|nr:glycoside hydrolase family 5 protein [Lachnospiraceae bacterium]
MNWEGESLRRWKGYEHGVNLGGWLSQCDHTRERYDNFIIEDDIRRISTWGLDHIRVPIDYNLVEDEAGQYKERGFEYIERAAEWAGKHGLNMILDLHKTYGFSFDPGHKEEGFFENEAYQERFYSLWEELARRFTDLGDRIAFELLNEVTDKEYCEAWNRIAATCIARIRVIAPKTKILVGGYWNNSIAAVKDILPPADENIVYNFHCYEPLIFTHQGAYWAPGMDPAFRISIHASYKELAAASEKNLTQVTVSMEGVDENASLGPEYFVHHFGEAVKVAEERDVPLYCGEYGVINLADPQESLEWYRIISEVFNRFGIGRAAWSYKEMDFGLIDGHMSDVFSELIKEL